MREIHLEMRCIWGLLLGGVDGLGGSQLSGVQLFYLHWKKMYFVVRTYM